MKNKHAKSPCCQERIIHFGNRRRQCVKCRKTWRIRKKKIGRKSKRVSITFVKEYLDRKIPPLYKLAQNKVCSSKDKLQRRLKRSLERFVSRTPWPRIDCNSSLIAVADAMTIRIQDASYSFYFILLRAIHSNKAIITKPFMHKGTESWFGWHTAFASLSPEIARKIQALVSDGHLGLLSVAKTNNWIIQRCNFHIIAKIQGRRSRWSRSRNKEEGESLYQLVHCVLTNRSNTEIQTALQELKDIIYTTKSTQLRRYLSGFVKNYSEYRSYLAYPSLNLPRTSNSAEVMVKYVRSLCNRAHGFRTIDSLALWVKGLVKHKKTITCNGFHQPN